MRIIVLTPTFLPSIGGAELVILQVYRRLATKHSVLVLTPNLAEDISKKNGSDSYNRLINFDVWRFRDRFTFMKIRGHRITFGMIPPFSISALTAIKRAIYTFKPDVINVHYVMPTGLAGLYANNIRKIPAVITYNGRDVPGPGVPRLWKYWHYFVGRNCADVTFVSKYCRDVIYGANSSYGHIIYNGVENPVPVSIEKICNLRCKLQIREDDYIIFALQRLDPLKRVDVLIQSMPGVLASKPKTRLIIGGEGSDLPRLKNLAAELRIEKQVIFTGFISDEDLPIYFNAADLFVFHSTFETFGIVLAEAMNYGKPIVAVDNTAISEVVDQGLTGLLVPTFDHQAFTGSILQLLNDPRRREEMGKRAKEKARFKFQWNKIAEQYEKVLESTISQ